MGTSDTEREYRAFLARATADDDVVGVVLFGSRGSGPFATDASDFDVFVVVRRAVDRWPYVHGAAVETVATTLDVFEGYALAGSPGAWNRPSFVYARVELDKLGGEIGRIVERKRRLTPDEARALASEALDDYVNALYRSLRNLEAGRDLEGRLDAAESIPPLLTTVFALEGRVRPFNKWLRYDLERKPPAIDGLLERIDRIVRDGDPGEQRSLFRDVERQARGAGHGGVIDGWEPDVDWLRGTRARDDLYRSR